MKLEPLCPSPENIQLIQNVLECAPKYSLLISGRPPSEGDGQDVFDEIPEGISPENKVTLGIYIEDEIIGVIDYLIGYPNFHTFNRNIFSWLVIIKFMEWFVPNTPKDLHILRLFIKPKELKEMMALNQLWQKKIVGIRPIFNSAFYNSIFQKKVLPGFSFRVGGASLLGYIGFSKKIKIWT